MYITNSNSKSSLIAEKINSILISSKKRTISNKRQFFAYLKELKAKKIIDEAEYSYCIANYYKVVLDLRFYHLLAKDSTDRLSGLEEIWMNVTKEFLVVYSKENIDTSESHLKEIMEEKFKAIFNHIFSQSSQEEISSPFSKSLQNIEDLNNPEQVSYTHFQESLQETQKILFELKEMLSLSGIVSPVLYEITKVARELPRSYTNKNDLIKDLKDKILNWEDRLKKNPSKLINNN